MPAIRPHLTKPWVQEPACLATTAGPNFNLFVKEVTWDRMAGAWYFSPLLDASAGKFRLVTVNLASGKSTSLQNTGGELHTFTRVAKFGGGFVGVPQRFDRKP